MKNIKLKNKKVFKGFEKFRNENLSDFEELDAALIVGGVFIMLACICDKIFKT